MLPRTARARALSLKPRGAPPNPAYLGQAVLSHAPRQHAGDPDAGRPSADDDKALLCDGRCGQALDRQRTIQAGHRGSGCALDVIVEH